jgi:hypothetical protein
MLKSNNTKLNAVLVVAVFAIAMTLGPAVSNYQTAFAHYGVDIDQCKDDEDYYEDNEEACDKNLRAHYDADYDGNFGSKSIDDDDDDDNDDNNGNGNSASQGIGQSQSSRQNSQCVSGDDTNDSCNNVSVQNQDNDGNNAAGQQDGGDDDDDGNRSNQGIGQSQSSRQNSQCVAGGSLGNSCNNVSVQNQDNDGNNAAAQSGGGDDDDDGNRSNQGIGQDQDSEQNSQCVSGEDATVSCNNVSFQNQVNSGNNALAQQD